MKPLRSLLGSLLRSLMGSRLLPRRPLKLCQLGRGGDMKLASKELPWLDPDLCFCRVLFVFFSDLARPSASAGNGVIPSKPIASETAADCTGVLCFGFGGECFGVGTGVGALVTSVIRVTCTVPGVSTSISRVRFGSHTE